MKIFRLLLLLVAIFSGTAISAATAPSTACDPGPRANMSAVLNRLSPKDVEKLTGKKLGLLQRLQLKIFLGKLKRHANKGVITAKQKKQARWSMILGIGSIVFLVVPVIIVLAIPMAIAALILGISSLKGNSNTEGIVGVVTGSLTLVIFLLAIAVLATFLSGFGFE